MSKNRRVSPRVFHVCAVNSIFENDDIKSLVKPSIIGISMKKIFCVARESCFVLKLIEFLKV